MWREVVDDLGRTLALPEPPQRIVSLVPSVTELICDLGASDRLVGVTKFCVEPAAVVAALPRVGGTKTADCAGLAALQPDLVVMNSEENDRTHFEALVAAGLTVFVSYPTSVAGAGQGIVRLATALGSENGGAELSRRIAGVAAALRPLIPGRQRVFCPIWRKPWMSFNADTFCHDILASAGGDNVCAGATQRYPVVELPAIAQVDPQVIVLPDEPYPFAPRHRRALEPLAGTAAWRDGRIHHVDGKALSWYGARTPAALGLFFRLLHPGTAVPDSLDGASARG
jgi:ABC-type Fe3+-hydroxamate transport system substrate-binding protein